MGRIKKNQHPKEFQSAHDFEKDPARCGNCRHRVIRRFFVKGQGLVSGKPTCQEGGFVTKPFSICDAWKGLHGEGLEKE